MKGSSFSGVWSNGNPFFFFSGLAPWILVGSLKPRVVDMSVPLDIFWVLLDKSVTGSPGCLKKYDRIAELGFLLVHE